MIKQIEHLNPELGVDTLRNGSGLEEREIDVFKARPVDAVTSVVTIGSKCRIGKCGRVDPLNDPALNRVGNARAAKVAESSTISSKASRVKDRVRISSETRKLTSRPFGAVTSHDVLSGFLLGSTGEWKANIA
jgi:hypothetical protein